MRSDLRHDDVEHGLSKLEVRIAADSLQIPDGTGRFERKSMSMAEGPEIIDAGQMRVLCENGAKMDRRLAKVFSETQMAGYKWIRAGQRERFREEILSKSVDNVARSARTDARAD